MKNKINNKTVDAAIRALPNVGRMVRANNPTPSEIRGVINPHFEMNENGIKAIEALVAHLRKITDYDNR